MLAKNIAPNGLTPAGKPLKASPFVVCRFPVCQTWAYVKEETRDDVKGWVLPPVWAWDNCKGGICPSHKERASHIHDLASDDSPGCPICGNLMLRTGRCHTCQSCGHNDGCG